LSADVYNYFCLNCSHEWCSPLVRDLLRCPCCHRRQGVSYQKFRKAVVAAKIALKRISESPPPHKPPLDVIANLPDVLEPVLKVASKEFPSPVVPINFLKFILGRAIDELREESKNIETSKTNSEVTADGECKA
jgi:hypothetical protein